MPIPSFYLSGNSGRPWRVGRAAAYGAALGALAGLFKIVVPWHASVPAAQAVLHVLGAAAAFSLLCAGAALLRNAIAQRLIWPQSH